MSDNESGNSDERQNEERLREKADAWLDEFNEALDDFFRSGSDDRDAFFDILWDKGVLNYVAPLDPDAIEARKILKKPVFEKGRNDPELYWRIMYSCAASLDYIERFDSIAGGYISGAIRGGRRLLFEQDEHEKRFKAMFEDELQDGKNIDVIVLEALLDRAKSALGQMGVHAEGHPVKTGTEVIFHGKAYTVDRLGGNGLVALVPESPDDMIFLSKYEIHDPLFRGLLPTDIAMSE